MLKKRNYWYDARCWTEGHYIKYKLLAKTVRRAKNRLKKLYAPEIVLKVNRAWR